MPTSKLLGGYAAVRLDTVKNLGGMAYVQAITRQRLYAYGRCQRTESRSLGGYARVAYGEPLGGFAAVRARQAPRLLGGWAEVTGLAGSRSAPFFPAEGRRFAEEETGYLQIEYKNFPLSDGQADVRWVFDGTVLPVNGVGVEWKEPVKEITLETQGARIISVIEEELDTPRTTRNRQISLDFPPVGAQVLQWFKGRMRVGREFYADFRLFDVVEDQWEEVYTDLSDPIFRHKRFWGSLGYWKPGTVNLRINGEPVSDFTTIGINHLLGFVEFWHAADPNDLIEVQYVYTPLVQIVEVMNNPKPGYAFNRFAPKVTMLELKVPDPAYSLSVPIAPPPPAGYSDSFNRADGNAVHLETQQPWVNLAAPGTSPLQIVNSQATYDFSGDHVYGVVTDSADGFAELAGYQTNAAASPVLIARYQDANNYLALYFGAGPFASDFNYFLVKIVGGVGTTLFQGGEGQFSQGVKLGLLMSGETVTLYLDRVRYGTFTVPELTTGMIQGMNLYADRSATDFQFRRPAEIYPQLFPGDPNADWLGGKVFYDSFNKPDGGGGFLETGQPWVDGDAAYPMQIKSGRCYSALNGALVNAGSSYVSVEVRLYEGQAAGNGQIVSIRANAHGAYFFDGADLYRVVDGVLTLLDGPGTAFAIPAGASSVYKIVLNRDHYIRCYRDGVLVCTSPLPETHFEDATYHGFSTGNYSNAATDFRMVAF